MPRDTFWPNMERTVVKDRAIVNAIARRDELGARLRDLSTEMQEIQREIASADKFINDYRKYADLSPAEEADLFGDLPDVPPPSHSGSNPRKEDLAPFIRDLIEQRNKPLTRNTIFSALESENIHLKGKDPKMILSTMLWRMQDQFVRLQGHGYWLTDRPYEPAAYVPPAERPPATPIRRR